jgi:hypothetical protein
MRDDRRKDKRVGTHIPALVQLQGGTFIECAVVDMSDTGAKTAKTSRLGC